MNSNINIENNLINNSYKNFLIVIILGYYGVKIVFSYFFKMYTNKYYDANILLNTTDNSGNNALKNIVINSYFPYTSNNDFSDFTILIILTFILYIFTENFVKSIFKNSYLNINFLMGYIIGLTYPLINYSRKSSTTLVNSQLLNSPYDNSLNDKGSQIGYIIIIFFSIIFIAVITMGDSNTKTLNKIQLLLIYIIVIIIVLYGLYTSKDNKYTLQNMSISVPNSQNYIQKFLIYSGEKLQITAPFICWLLLLLYGITVNNNDNSFLLYIIYGILLGILVSGVSFYGIKYILNRDIINSCNSRSDCIAKLDQRAIQKLNRGQVISEEEQCDILDQINKLTKTNKNKYLKIYSFLIIIVVILLIMIFYFYFTSTR